MSHRHSSRKYIAPQFENQWIIMALIDKLEKLPDEHTMIYTCKYALDSITEWPTVITTKQEVIKVKHIKAVLGGYLFDDITQNQRQEFRQKAQQYLIAAALQNNNITSPSKSKSKPNPKPKTKPKPVKFKIKTKKPYHPQHKSGAWSILFVLTKAKNNGIAAMTKHEIIAAAKPYCRSNLEPMHSQDYFTAWRGITTLFKHKYIEQIDTKYKLRVSGYTLGQQLITEHNRKKNKENKKSGIRPKKRRNIPPALDDITNYSSPPPIKKRKICTDYPVTPIRRNSNNTSLFAGFDLNIVDNLHKKYDLNNPIVLNNKRYALYLVVDKREEINSHSKRIDIFHQLNDENRVPVKERVLSCGDFVWTLENIDNTQEIFLLPFIIERKTYADLVKSIKDERYRSQKRKMSFAAKNILIGGRKIYLIEGGLKEKGNNVLWYQRNMCKQACASTESRDGYAVFYTNNKQHTLSRLIDLTFMIRAWIDGEYSKRNAKNNINVFKFGKLIRLDVFEDKIKEKKVRNEITARQQWMVWLLKIDGMDECMAYCISMVYPTLRCLDNAWNECHECHESKSGIDEWKCRCDVVNKKAFQYCYECQTSKMLVMMMNRTEKDVELEKLLIHNTVSIPYWKYASMKIENNECEKPDDDVMNCLNALKEMNNDGEKVDHGVSEKVPKGLSIKIWTEFRGVVNHQMESKMVKHD